MPFSTVD